MPHGAMWSENSNTVRYERVQRVKRFQGKYWARMPHGESCFDVCTRVANLFGTIVRDRQPAPLKGRDGIDNLIVVPPSVCERMS